ncbi:MAG: valine--tRNA ligase [Candidatus Bathyarchaeota archaeon]
MDILQSPELKSLPKQYKPREAEARWQSYWLIPQIYETAYKFAKYDSDRTAFIIDTPPPFTSGELHVGHAYWNIINDTLARYKRLRGYNVLLPQGWDCQGLPTELKVQNMWKIPKTDRIFFRQKCDEWTQQMIISMKETMVKLGYRPDWEQFEYRTTDPSYQRNVQLTILNLYEKGLVYRDAFPVHWCPKCETALAQAELGYVEEKGMLYFIKFHLNEGYTEVATTRPELLAACQALAVHPEDERYMHLIGKVARVPIYDREVPILTDPTVDIAFGTGVVMICTFGDEQDIRWQQKYGLPTLKIINEQGRIINTIKYDGLRILEARKAILSDLTAAGMVLKKEEILHKVLAHTERPDCMTPVEFLIKTQFFIKTKPFKDNVVKACKEMKWTPPYMLQRLVDWADSIEWDWLISRQRIYGTPIPFWYCSSCNEIIPALKEQLPVTPEKGKQPVDRCPKCGSEEIEPSPDVCDCWVDSSITPLIISGYFEDEVLFKRSYPTSIRQQGHDIIRTWLFYTTLRCLLLTGKQPFKEVLINGHILGPDAHKMSKSKGNVISPTDRLEEFGADALRQALLSLTIGSDFPFKWEAVKYNKGFLQKYWSVSRFAHQFIKDYKPIEEDIRHLGVLDKWVLARLIDTIIRVAEALDNYEFHLALDAIQNFIWHEFCDQYVEAVKHRLYDNSNEESYRAAQYTLHTVLWNSNIIFAPICPHITEEIYHTLFSDTQSTVHAELWPCIENIPLDERSKQRGNIIIDMIANLRNEKAKLSIPLNSTLERATISAPSQNISILKEAEEDFKRILHIKEISYEESETLKIVLAEH